MADPNTEIGRIRDLWLVVHGCTSFDDKFREAVATLHEALSPTPPVDLDRDEAFELWERMGRAGVQLWVKPLVDGRWYVEMCQKSSLNRVGDSFPEAVRLTVAEARKGGWWNG